MGPERECERVCVCECGHLSMKWLEEQINKGQLGNWHSPSLSRIFSFLSHASVSIYSSSSISVIPSPHFPTMHLSFSISTSYFSLIVQQDLSKMHMFMTITRHCWARATVLQAADSKHNQPATIITLLFPQHNLKFYILQNLKWL